MKKTDIILLTGFLGSGKTTLLKQCLQSEIEKKRKVAVIMNEIGKISIDSQEVPEDIRLKELLNGCVCCTMKDQLETQLLSLVQNNELDCIYIETTGVANTVDVIDACTSAMTVESLTIKGVLSTIDATRWNSKNDLSPAIRYLLIQQITYSDVVLVNRIDQLSSIQKDQVRSDIKLINPNLIEKIDDISNFLDNLSTSKKDMKNTQINVHHTLKIKTYIHEQYSPYNKAAFEEFLKNASNKLFRLKGYISFQNDSNLYNVQYSNGFISYEKELMKLPKRLVLIGEDLNSNFYEKELNKLI
ncbi:CobW family GTP-binding protein [Gottfriedia luciferensis]|uniref:CobW family GTP-binding protein n=1 Tax=Gottfriedia luciferensis TaxID=178774 RepID=UPI000B4394AB|nr:GTP-binding protein [Gottfriedia luciferensis]